MGQGRFLHGVASGDPTAGSIVLWTRVTREDDVASPGVSVRWTIRDESSRHDVASGEALASSDHDDTVHVAVDGLAPDTAYTYSFAADGESSPAGRFRTLSTAASAMQFGVVACAKFNAGYFNAYRCLARRDDLQFVAILGDYIYEAANKPPASQTPGADIGRDFSPPHECYTLDDYRARYALYRADPDTQAFHRAHAVVATIDDHELADNAWAGGSQEHDPAEHGPWSERAHAALRAWEEWMPTMRRPATGGQPIYQRVDVGGLFTLMLLETRTNRSGPEETDPARRTEFGPEQLGWMQDVAATTPNPWLFVGVPSTVVPLWDPGLDDDASFALRKLKLVEPKEGTPFHDLWDSFPGERHALMGLLRGTRATPVILSGDVHVGLESELRDGDELVAHEWTTASVTSQNLDDKMGWPRREQSLHYEERVRAALPHIRWCDFDSHGYMVVTVDRENAACEWWAVDTVLSESDTQAAAHASSVQPNA
ncbi:MAG TPA: alkaline phosphatase D family protein [Acidimicrobiia bacterium]|nr:alkaline phosphatase D family protein [Acidimicrobiia bacterium]